MRLRVLMWVWAVLAILAAVSIAVRGQEGGPVKHAVLVALDASDNYGTFRATLGGLLARLSGRDEEPTEPGTFGRYVLSDTNPERSIRIYVGYEQGTRQSLLDLLNELPSVITNQTQFAAPVTRGEMLAALRIRAQIDNFEWVWDLRAGGRTDGLILSHFVPAFP